MFYRIYAKPSNTSSAEGPGYTAGASARPVLTAAEETGGRFELSDHGYGKGSIKLLHVHRDGEYHTIREFEVSTELKLASETAYVIGDNKEVVATDSQKNTVYLLAKKHGVKTPEEFGALVVNHFLYMYKQVVEAKCHIMEYPWERLQAGAPHNHAFVFSSTATRWCEVSQTRHGEFSDLLLLYIYNTINTVTFIVFLCVDVVFYEMFLLCRGCDSEVRFEWPSGFEDDSIRFRGLRSR